MAEARHGALHVQWEVHPESWRSELVPFQWSNTTGKSPRSRSVHRKITHKWTIFQQAMFDYRRVQGANIRSSPQQHEQREHAEFIMKNLGVMGSARRKSKPTRINLIALMVYTHVYMIYNVCNNNDNPPMVYPQRMGGWSFPPKNNWADLKQNGVRPHYLIMFLCNVHFSSRDPTHQLKWQR